MNTANSIHFPPTYRDSRTYFRGQLDRIKKIWTSASLDKYFIDEEKDLSIDWISAEPIKKKEKLVLITTGLHGVEGFVGAAMLDLFIKENMPSLDPSNTGLLFVHSINPWGMANFRRFNRNNVDLNRNFFVTPDDFNIVFNQNYLKLDQVLNPRRPLKPFWQEDPRFLLNVISNLARYGIQSLREAVMHGQQSNPEGLYFSGREYQQETTCIRNLIEEVFTSYSDVLHLDMHTGYGPSDQMSLVTAPSESRKSEKLMSVFNYPLVVKADPEEFYSMQGDMIDWIYQYQQFVYPGIKYFGAACEFGTYGDGTLMETKSLRTMIFINQADQHGTISPEVESRIHAEFVEMYFPSSPTWREKALLDCRQAFRGILSAEGYI